MVGPSFAKLSAAELDRLKGVQPEGAAETGTRHPLELVSCALMGVVFGIALEKGRVVDPIAMRGQFIFRRWFMMKFPGRAQTTLSGGFRQYRRGRGAPTTAQMLRGRGRARRELQAGT